MKKHILFLLYGLAIVIIDQLTKMLFTNKNFFIINYYKNYGLLFGFQFNQILIIILTLILIIILCLFYFFTKFNKLALIFIVSGLISNLIDRVFLSYIRDFIDFKFWPIFNLADLICVVGVLIIIKESKW